MDKELFGHRLIEKPVLLLCEKSSTYKGLERVTPYAHDLFPARLINEVLYMADKNGDIPYSCDNFRKLHKIQKKLAIKGLELEIILAGNAPNDSFFFKTFTFLGYDVSGDSLCHSLIFRYFFDDSCSKFDTNSKLIGRLNQNGLCSDISTAYEFITSVSIHSQLFEHDNNIAPIAIWGTIV